MEYRCQDYLATLDFYFFGPAYKTQISGPRAVVLLVTLVNYCTVLEYVSEMELMD